MNVAVIGLGLIGGSMALELKHKGFSKHIIGVDNSESHKDQALKLKIVDETCSIEEAIKESQLIILSTPVNVSSKIILSILNIIDNQILMDVGSTKHELIKKIKSHPKRKNFVATHPIAGTEFSGPAAAHLGLFKDKVNIICDQKDSSPKALNTIKEIYDLLEMKTIFMTAEDHDVHSAYVSHISHISSFSLALSVMDKEKDEKNILNMAGSGFESTVRLAKSNKEMWTPIFNENKKNILEVLENYIGKLNDFKDAINNDNESALNHLIQEANGIKKILK
jgi:prephenate dehydrogenase